ncbi:MAG: hypothetical protein A2268_15880 [Candidatus Raymondbacteria bacterium RifOxyA12_full_50_37]|nr:MAG: hypothetical protein A2268_15880 [Candidatus Raymondbacteria bacterium RifOxyA12_full_50_37]OGJ89230.1 MAG: hypothetical protein A2248_18775 [Candidatus Raymondbacteria bacterium RIFOXYA2_FULL_49_16]OGJ96482.1 MAG: hypothetical protein A2487_20535 [Candidatus Raymondbacteria bacterium RifOxyC12_full_50_8]OGJ97396.1 MAG: hypothetical protein A2453_03695 [Candidatus Raymondbacteria bacterium RIFOXYC2_FULL_50_21]OGJ99869.1 MAG: hypothetical protein A2350_18195 [Candidatus Raymondbacteria b
MDLFSFSDSAQSFKASEIRELMKFANEPGIITFAGGMPDAAHFPVKEVTSIINTWDEPRKRAAFQYGATDGYPSLLATLAKRMEKQGLSLEGQRIIITTGAQQGLFLVSEVLLNPGDVVIAESPSFIGAIAAFKSFQARIAWVALENDGISIVETERTIRTLAAEGKKPKFIYTIPNFQNPAGITLSQEKRKQLLDLALAYGIPILEDDPYGELYYAGSAADYRPIKALPKARECVLYLNTFSKILSPGMRLGWLTGCQDIINTIEVAKQSVDACSSSYTQVIAHDYLEKGYVDGYVTAMRDIYREKCGAMLHALTKYMPQTASWSHPTGGFFIWITLPQGVSALKLFEKTIARNVAFVTGHPFMPEGMGDGTIRLAFSNASLREIDEGVRIIGDALKG